jgi:two-component system sensor histidine kinase CiaH
MFSRARFRLTAWFVVVMAGFVVVLGGAVYYVVREQLRNQVDNGVRTTAKRVGHDVYGDYIAGGRAPNINYLADGDIRELAKGGLYKLFVVAPPFGTGVIGRGAVEAGLPYSRGVIAALQNGHDLAAVHASQGSVQVYSVAVADNGGVFAVVQVARSTLPEQQSLDKLLIVLLASGAASILIAAIGGWFLAGKALAPVREAFDRQHAFVGDASHELRTPLAVIRANAEYLQSSQPDSVEIADIVSETDRLSALVDSLLALARGGRGDRVQPDVFDMGSVVEQSVDAMTALAAEKEIDLRVEASPGLHIEGDREQIRQLVVILVDNALRYTPAGGSVAVIVGKMGNDVALEVRDTGIGIPRDAQDHVFERFYRADEARNRDSGGAGLGLAIAKQLVEEHEGKITLESVPGEGSTFTVRLPQAGATAATTA